MKALVVFFILTLATLVVAEEPIQPTCPDPPYNNGISHIVYNELDKLHGLMKNGIPSRGIPPLDPLGPLPTMNFTINDAYVRLKGSLQETIIRHLSEFTTCEITIELGLRQSLTMDLRMDNFRADGNYILSGVYALLFPIFGDGIYTLDVYNTSLSGGADISYNLITSHAQLHNLVINISYEDLQLYLECINGCGDMSDYINAHLSNLITKVFNSVWERIDPILTNFLENAINAILKNIKIKLPAEDLSGASFEAPQITRFKVPLKKLFAELQL